MTTSVRSLGFLVALAGIMPLGAQNRPAVQLTLVSTELAEGDALRVSVRAEGLAGQRVVLFEGAGHFPHLDQPERFAQLLSDFIRR